MQDQEIKEAFENAFLAIPDVDETLLKKTDGGKHVHKEVEFYEYWYVRGYKRAVTEFLSEESKKIIAYMD